jgi:hypothetical protein
MFKKKIEEKIVKSVVNKEKSVVNKESDVYVVSQEVVNNGGGGHVEYHLSDGTISLINPNK